MNNIITNRNRNYLIRNNNQPLINEVLLLTNQIVKFTFKFFKILDLGIIKKKRHNVKCR